MANKEKILVTGSGGFIGGWIVEMLHLNHQMDVRAGIRSWSSAARLARFPIEIVLCDVMDKESISRALDGTTRVIHCVSGSDEVIVEGTRNMLEMALARKVDRFVHLSTTEVYGNVSGGIEESCPFQSIGDSYGDAKIEAEKLCWAYYKKDLSVTVVRPPIVYGPFSRDWTVGFAKRLQSGNWGVFKGYGEGICNLIYIVDLVSGILLAAQNESAIGEAFNLVGPESITWNQYFQKFNSELGLPKLKVVDPANARLRAAIMDPIRSLGKFVLNNFNAPLRKLSQGNRQARELMLYADKSLKTNPRFSELALYNREARYLSTKAHDLLGFNPVFGLDRGLEMSVSWLKYVGLVS